ncbi:hypothetical protein FSP39_024189 [Pinctada imbricata]|uniref:Uncharacterized protein n=1 Tax=Pinctada imbricata TaxID=66713 RepID=A0AA88YBP5_PINIB|nr:hypothetical protein FSP39_024189 [Pinctada imbricata]
MANSIAAPIVNQKSGTDFLASTNFKVAQDMSVFDESMCSVFKKDYPPYRHYGRDSEAERPVLAEVMTRDGNFFKPKASETAESFEYRFLPKPVIIDTQNTLRRTNFKMDKDVDKVNVFETMHNSYFQPKMSPDYKRAEALANTVESHIPQGDPQKAPKPCSDYRERFQGHDTSVHKVYKAPSMHEGGPPTIIGDKRTTNFHTTHEDQFQGRWEKPVQTLPVPPSYNVPRGDPDKVLTKETTMQSSYPFISDRSQTTPYSKAEVSAMLRRTNYSEKDGHMKYNDYKSTATSSYKPVSTPLERFRPEKHRNHSDLPEGDHDKLRNVERVNMTTARYYHGNPALGLHNTIISGANLRTKSNVQLSEPHMTSAYYNTTMGDKFPSKSVPYTYDRTKFHKESNIPLKYYDENDVNHTSMSIDYKNPSIGRIRMHPSALENLRMSHILPPLSAPQKHSTTHQVMFTPKTSEKYSYDSGRLQKSSVPLGTLNIK